MEFHFYGANCIRIATKKASVIIDDNLAELGAKSVTKSTDVSIMTRFDKPSTSNTVFNVNYPGEYEVSGVSVWGIAARAHMDNDTERSAVIYKLSAEDIQVCVLGHIHPDLSADQLEQIGMVDVLIVPVGGHGYTLDPVGALKVIKKIEPKIIIPTHYDDAGLRFEVPQMSLEDALKEMAIEPAETTEKLKLKKEAMPGVAQMIVVSSSR